MNGSLHTVQGNVYRATSVKYMGITRAVLLVPLVKSLQSMLSVVLVTPVCVCVWCV